jgi:DNA invertase Pin-like site-specific DNA recombinase
MMNKIFGYCRISTAKQSIERQERNIKAAYPEVVIVREVYTGTKVEGRSEWEKLYKAVKSGDTIVFDSVSRMSRNAAEGVNLYMDLFNKGVNLVFLKESYINTEVYQSTIEQTIRATGNDIADIYIEATNKVIKLLAEKQIIKAFEQSEKEVEDLHQRTREGIETARLNGKQIGRAEGSKVTTKKSIEMKEKIQKMAKDFGGNMTDKEVIETLKIARNTYFKYKRELKN